MSKQVEDRPVRESPFATKDRVPSAAMIDKLLRAVEDAPGTVLDERTVDLFCGRIRESARLLSNLPMTSHPTDRAESFHYLLMMVAYAVDSALLNPDPLEPMFSAPYRLHLLDWGAASPDSIYRRAMLRDDRSYRVHGRLGNAKYFSFDFRQSRPACSILREEIDVGRDGSFEIFLGGTERKTNWWPLTSGTTGLVVREFFDDWLAVEPSRLRVDCLDGETAPRPEHCARRVAAEFDLVGDWVLEGAIRYWAEQSTRLAVNAKNGFLPNLARGDTKLPVTGYGWWELADDEALILEFPDPQAEFWGLHLATSLWHTLDYANRLTTHNSAQARRDSDGTYRLVVSATDPGLFNWLDTMGLERGVLIHRLCRARNGAPPSSRVVKLSEIADALPAAGRCTPEERRAQIAGRREGVARMLCD